jgi:hypothetical protein
MIVVPLWKFRFVICGNGVLNPRAALAEPSVGNNAFVVSFRRTRNFFATYPNPTDADNMPRDNLISST